MTQKTVESLVKDAQRIVIIQADNPDGDSLASSLALEAIFTEMGKKPYMYCGVDIPSYLRYMDGWDRVLRSLPKDFDLSIIVDTSSLLLLENLQKTDEIKWLKTKPCIIIDHHSSEPTIDFAAIEHIEHAVSTGELLYELAKEHSWPVPLDAAQFIVYSILSDSLGLISESTSPRSVRIVAELMDKGVSLAALDAKRKEFQKKQPELLSYKGDLLKRIGYSESGNIAYIDIPWEEIEKYSPLYNPPMLVIDEMRQTEGVMIAVAFKSYPDGRVTAKLRSNYGYPVCAAVAEQFGGGGHPYASGFRVTDGTSLEEVKEKCFKLIDEELAKLEK
jgi:phosphoesterase RecJ-like protein